MNRVLTLIALAGASLAATVPARAQENGARSPAIVTRDLDNFWHAWDRASEAATWADSVAAFEEHYRADGSPGLEDFFAARIENVDDLLREVRSAPRYYAQLRPQASRVASFVPEIETVFDRWREIYPEADLPDVFFLIGRRNSAGTTSRDRILIGTEMFGLTSETPDDELGDWLREVLKPVDALPGIVAHELIHTQSRQARGNTLLRAAIVEGSADFLGELISGFNINRHVHEWADPREAELWSDFQEVMDRDDISGWLYSSRSEDEPADLGYWMGYKITEAFYERAEDKQAAVREILTIRDYPAFLEASGYDPD